MPWKPFLVTRNPIVTASGHQTSKINENHSKSSKITENHQGLDDQAPRHDVVSGGMKSN